MIGRLLRRLTGGDEAARDAERAVRKLAETQRERDAQTQARLTELRDLLAQRATAKDANEILHAVRALGTQLRRAGKADGPGAADAPGRAHEAKLHKLLDQLAQSGEPIVAGPWTGEVGFELLYWIPFLAWARTRWKLADERFIIISRGGTASWYGMPGARYVDILSLITPAAFRAGTDPDAHKQRSVSPFDEQLTEAALQRVGVTQAGHLHPSLLYRNLMPFWQGEEGFGALERLTLFRPLDPQAEPPVPGLPDRYLAARFYFSDSFPDTPANREAARAIITNAARRMPVVVVGSGLRVDDHADLAPDAAAGVTLVSTGDAPERNLAVQSAVIGRARGFIGTYGGLSYLAPFYGVPAVAYYSARAFQLHHLHVAQWALERLGAGTVTAIDVAQGDLVHTATAGLAADTSS